MTINWRFISEELFNYAQSSPILPLTLAGTLVLLAHYRWLARDGGIPGFLQCLIRENKSTAKQKAPLESRNVCRWLLESNLLGVILAKSLHLQFLTWYMQTIPLLLLATDGGWVSRAGNGRLGGWGGVCLWVALEGCWNIFPFKLDQFTVVISFQCFSIVLA